MNINSCKNLVLILLCLGLMSGCNPNRGTTGSESAPGTAGSSPAVSLQGAGATFPNPLYQKWLSEYSKQNPNVKIDYQSIGSGGGVKQLLAQTVDFGASDDPMKDEDLKKAPGEIIHIPTVLGAVAIAYNLADVKEKLKLSSDLLADIFLGKIKKWNDARIKSANPGLNLPATDIIVVHRSDGSGTTAVFTDYLSKVSPEWKQKVGSGKSVDWPTGIGGKGNEGVSGSVKQTPGTIGYLELAYATQNNLPVAQLKNRAGTFVDPTLESVSAAAAEALPNTPEDLRVSITDAAGHNAYPLASYTYILVYKDVKDPAKRKVLADFLWWGIHEGEKFAADLHYAPLPDEVVKKVEQKINIIRGEAKQGA